MILNKKESSAILLATLIIAFIFSLIETFELFLYTLLAVFIVIITNILSKKLTSYHLDSEIEIKMWEIKRYGFKPGKHFKRPFPAGAFMPIIITAFSFGALKWMASLVFDVKAKVYRAAKRHELYSFSEMTEFHIGLIAGAGILVNLISAVIGYLMGFPIFTKISIFYAFYNLIPISDLDGNKIFFGNVVLWSFLVALTLVGLGFIFLVI